MQKILIALSFILLILNNNYAQESMNEKDKVSYAYGMLIADQLKSQGLKDLNVDKLSQGINASFKGDESIMDMMAAKQAISDYQNKKQASAATDNKLAGAAFLAENGKRTEVTTLASGLQYEVLATGTGPTPNASSKVKTHYHGTLINGEVFDSSVDRGEPISFPVNGVIAGWTEALQLMKVGDKWRLFIPSELAYGERGAGAAIGPNAALVFEVELLGIE